MAYIPTDRLKNGEVEFLDHLSSGDINHIIKQIRIHPDRVNIINGFLPKLIEKNPNFCFQVIYDIPEYNFMPYTLLLKHEWGKEIDLNIDVFKGILASANYRNILITNCLDKIIELGDEYISLVCQYVINNREVLPNLLETLSRSTNMYVRYIFMRELININMHLVKEIYGDICKFFVAYTYRENEQLSLIPEQMDIKDICDIAIQFLKKNNIREFRRIKEYILTNYKSNMLAYMLDRRIGLLFDESVKTKEEKEKQYALRKKELMHDLDRLFATSSTYKIHLYQDYHDRISKRILEDFEERTKYFRTEIALSSNSVSRGIEDERVRRALFRDSMGYGINVSNVYNHGLGDTLEEYVDKYLSMSSRADYEFISEGSTTATYRIGDYAFKLVRHKWSYEDVICPNLYLIVKNLEEIYIRNRNGVVESGIEVQPFLSRSARDLDKKYFKLFKDELGRLGYYSADTLVNGSCGDNVMLLDTYLDADTSDPESLPDWFKEYPIVIVDRDLIFKKGNKLVKRLHGGY